ncbi:hypothetical protein KO361_04805 [Candidatus Woesearchaeota archaeon]|nr:hypothetical protein [Candidatus Woesearchaeota archaeon]
MKKNLKGQAWSIDIIIGVVLFLILLVVVYTLVATSRAGTIELRRNAELIHTKFDKTKSTHPDIPSILSGNILEPDKLQELMAKEYDEIKRALGITGEFCIVITHPDEGIYEVNGKKSFGDPSHGLIVGQNETGSIYCGQ